MADAGVYLFHDIAPGTGGGGGGGGGIRRGGGRAAGEDETKDELLARERNAFTLSDSDYDSEPSGSSGSYYSTVGEGARGWHSGAATGHLTDSLQWGEDSSPWESSSESEYSEMSDSTNEDGSSWLASSAASASNVDEFWVAGSDTWEMSSESSSTSSSSISPAPALNVPPFKEQGVKLPDDSPTVRQPTTRAVETEKHGAVRRCGTHGMDYPPTRWS